MLGVFEGRLGRGPGLVRGRAHVRVAARRSIPLSPLKSCVGGAGHGHEYLEGKVALVAVAAEAAAAAVVVTQGQAQKMARATMRTFTLPSSAAPGFRRMKVPRAAMNTYNNNLNWRKGCCGGGGGGGGGGGA